MYKKIIAAVFTVCVISSVQVYAEQSYPYNNETDCFEVPYTAAMQEELQEPIRVTGEVHATGNSLNLKAILPNGNTLNAVMPWRYEYLRGGATNYYYEEYSGILQVCDADGNKIITRESDLVPVCYKGNWFLSGQDNGAIYQINPDTLENTRAFRRAGLYPYETEQKTFYESDGGYEVTPGHFVRSVMCAYPRYSANKKRIPKYLYAVNNRLEYSCDGVYYIKVQNPDSSRDQQIERRILNGADCICLYSIYGHSYAFKIEDLKKCWEEYTKNAPYVYLNGVRLAFDRPPVIKNGTTLMPLRFLLESAGAEVEWEEAKSRAVIFYNDTEIKITNNSDCAYINDTEYKLSEPAQIIDGKMMIPLRFVSEGLGFTVDWQQETGDIDITVTPDNIKSFVPPFAMTTKGVKVKINGEAVESINADGRTLIRLQYLNKYFDFKQGSAYDTINMLMRDKPFDDEDTSISDETYKEYDMSCVFPLPLKGISINSIDIPVYDSVYRSNASDIEYYAEYYALFCIEEVADRIDCLHYEWIEEENTLYVYISDDMVTYDNALKAVLDKKKILYNKAYTDSYFKDIDAMQSYSNSDLAVLVQAGIKAGIIKESDYPDGHLRPTRNISHIDFARMLKGIGYKYSFKADDANIPITQEELNAVVNDL